MFHQNHRCKKLVATQLNGNTATSFSVELSNTKKLSGRYVSALTAGELERDYADGQPHSQITRAVRGSQLALHIRGVYRNAR